MKKPHKNTTHGMSFTSTYNIWSAMKRRCDNSNVKNYQDYGGRGITYCERWSKFENFLEDMGEKPEGYSIERVENSGPYCKENCRWATSLEQGRNKRNNIPVTLKGETKTLKEWSILLNVPYKVAHQRIKRDGYTPEEALTRPMKVARGTKW